MRAFIAGFLSTLLLFCFACQNQSSEQQTTTAIAVRLVNVQIKEMRLPIQSFGLLHFGQEQALAFKTDGFIQQILVKEGQRVKKGQLLATLDLREIEARVNQARAQFRKAKKDWQRLKHLYQDSVVTLDQLEKAKTAFELARAELQVAEFNLNHSKILAPAAGMILKILKKEQELIGPGQPVLLFGNTNAGWQVRCGLTDQQVSLVAPGDSATVTVNALSGQLFIGYLSEIAGIADPQSATFETTIQLRQSHPAFRSGFAAKVEIFPRHRSKLSLIPYQSLVFGKGNQTFLFTVGQNHQAQKIKVQVRYYFNDLVAVEGLPKTVSQVVAQGAAYLKPGAKVQIVN